MERTTVEEIVIKPETGLGLLDLRDAFRYRELLYFLVWRDIKVRYKQSVLGVAWVILKPLVTMVIFTVLFGRIAGFPSDGVPYAVFVMSGLIPWIFFSATLTASTGSIVGGGGLVSKVYFPRIIIPAGAVLSQVVDLLISFLLLLGMMAVYSVMPGWGILWTPFLFVFAGIAAIGPGMFFSALYVKYRDVGHVMPFMVQVWMYVTPVIYPASFIPERYRWVMYINPMSGVVEAFRASLLPGRAADLPLIFSSMAISAAMLAAGFLYFKSVERTFADNI